MYFNMDKKSRAEAALRALKQMKSVADYIHLFNIHTHHSGWEQRMLVSQYTQGLKKDIRIALVLSRTEFDLLVEVAQLALKIDNEINREDAGPNPLPAQADPNAMDVSAFKGQMSNRKQNQMMRAGLCFWCGEHSHLSCNCPQKGKGRDTTRISKLEAELKKLKEGVGQPARNGKGEGSKNGGAQA
jgi:hypothetical protein